jgi:hypothetical protein
LDTVAMPQKILRRSRFSRNERCRPGLGDLSSDDRIVLDGEPSSSLDQALVGYLEPEKRNRYLGRSLGFSWRPKLRVGLAKEVDMLLF